MCMLGCPHLRSWNVVWVEDMHVSVELHSIKQKGGIWVSLASESAIVKRCLAKQTDIAEGATDLVMHNVGLKREPLVTDGA